MCSLLIPAAALVACRSFRLVALPPGWQLLVGSWFRQPTTMSWIAALADVDRLASTLGLRVSGNRVGQLFVPILVGGVIALTSVDAGFWALAALLAATALLFGAQLFNRKA